MDTASNLTPVLGRYFEREWSHGAGHRLYDTDGRGYLDFANGIAVTALGHTHPRVTAAIHAQVDRLIGPISAIGFTEPISRLATEISKTFPEPLDSVFFLNSGSEAIDGALKLARRVTGRPGIIAFRGGFHGRTWGATSVTSSSLNYRTGYEPLLPGVQLTTFPAAYRGFGGDEEAAVAGAMHDLRALTSSVLPATAVASILIEPVQGEGGFNPAPPEFLRQLRAFCDEHGILLIADEVQSGFGRTGRMWAFEHAGIVPDVVVIAKSIANGLPLSAIVSSRDLQERWGRGAHGSTYAGNPVACAAGLAVLETIHGEGLIANAAARGAELRAGLERIAAEDDRIGDIRGPGMMIGVEFVRDRATREADGTLPDRLSSACADAGLLVLTCGRQHEVIRWIPPLDVTSAEINEGIEIFGETLATIPHG
ncbi:MAG: aspartate aminotransferase family protein [Chloroflexota bacterium]|jgi:4-aminobutyrate aminotransferase|nr:aspartate aminotransferase family protein [Chloroflexota bacterium]MDH5243431.1 aspartate aminotransferase family protein [Chloroflexota bacterium]